MSDDWQAEMSALYRQLAQIAVPARAQQIATLLTLLPFAAEDTFRVVELASGEGYLAEAIVRAFPRANLLALDYEASMRKTTRARLNAHAANRSYVASFDIRRDDWFHHLQGADAVVSSLCVHHLDAARKRRLFAAAADALSERGTLLIADLVAPSTPQARRLYAQQWDDAAQSAAAALGDDDAFAAFQREHWNLYRYPDPDFDKPSRLYEQLQWLHDAGFAAVDSFWQHAGHAIYGGYGAGASDAGISYAHALSIAQTVLKS